MDGHGQPALLYIVPFTVGMVLACTVQRVHLLILFSPIRKMKNGIEFKGNFPWTGSFWDRAICPFTFLV